MTYKDTKKGFTIMETLVAIAILTIGITAPITVVFNAIQSANVAQDQITANYLAEEGIEYIRYVRDTNIIQGDPWLNNLQHCLSSDGSGGDVCNLVLPTDVVNNNGDFINCGAGPCGPIEFDGTFYKGDRGPGAPTAFVRDITINEVIVDREAELVVTVTWTTSGTVRSFSVQERLLNWSGI